jgi:dienelactone hydrolase
VARCIGNEVPVPFFPMHARPALGAITVALTLAGCAAAEPLDLPEAPAETGVPVGVRTIEHEGATIEIWYPAPDDTSGPGEIVDFGATLSDALWDRLGEAEVATIPTDAVRDAAVRRGQDPYPVILFSHGFGGIRTQSPDLTVHLASRGYVVISADHPGRMFGDVLPCLFINPPVEGCNLDGLGGPDPAPAQGDAMLDWVSWAADHKDSGFTGRIDPEHIGMTGHSAGGGTTTTWGASQTAISALLPMAGAQAHDSHVPTRILSGTCDAIVKQPGLDAAAEATPGSDVVALLGAGHLAFSDICTLDLAALAEEHLADRTDVNKLILDSLVGLGSDGCPGPPPEDPPSEDCAIGYPDLASSQATIRHYATTFFDEHLRDAPADDEVLDGVARY